MPSTNSSDSFTLVETMANASLKVSDDFHEAFSGKSFDMDLQMTAALRRRYPNHTLTIIPTNSVNLLSYAFQGNAKAFLDNHNEDVIRWRSYQRGWNGSPGSLGSFIRFAKYDYTWLTEDFMVYYVPMGYYALQYILHECSCGEKASDDSEITGELIKAVGLWATPPPPDYRWIYIFDNYWMASRALYDEIQKSSWDDVILDDQMKTAVTEIVHKFFDSKDVYDDLGVPWRRGVIFHGPAGNGKTISIKAIMHTLSMREDTVKLLYVKSAPNTYAIRSVFQMARAAAPCLLVLEDIDTIVTQQTRSYFFNEVDGLERNDGILMLASTNHLDQLDDGLSKRPSRFDRKYLFPNPSSSERVLYVQYWRDKLSKKSSIKFPQKLCRPMAKIMEDFSFAYMKEAFVATLLAIAGNRTEKRIEKAGGGPDDDDDDDLDDYELWREMKTQVAILRDDMGSSKTVRGEEHFGHGRKGDQKVEVDAEGRITMIEEKKITEMKGSGPGTDPAIADTVYRRATYFVPDCELVGGDH
ncbi:hypothetical protein MMC13_003905 [Lambiella insularis]|nr:hypothetical protein [Lambiella insularis]